VLGSSGLGGAGLSSLVPLAGGTIVLIHLGLCMVLMALGSSGLRGWLSGLVPLAGGTIVLIHLGLCVVLMALSFSGLGGLGHDLC